MRNAVLLAAATCLLSATAEAETPRGVWFAGAQVSDSSSAYAGVVSALPGGSLGHGLAFRLSGSAGAYSYFAGSTRIRGKYQSAETALVYQQSGNWGWANFSAGPRYSHNHLSPDDPNNDLRGSRLDLALQTDGAFDGKWRLSWLGSIGVVDHAYQGKLQLSDKLSKTGLRLGCEAGVLGDPSFAKKFLGAFIDHSIGGKVELQVATGVTQQHGEPRRVYGSLALSQVF